MIWPGAHLRLISTEPLTVPFTGEYHLFRTSSGSLPAGSVVEAGTPLENLYGTTNGGPMETLAVQKFDPAIDLSQCAQVIVLLTSAEATLSLASMQFVTEGGLEDAGSDLMGMKPEREQLMAFQVPVTVRPLRVQAIRISFQRPGPDRDKNVRIAVERFTFVPRER